MACTHRKLSFRKVPGFSKVLPYCPICRTHVSFVNITQAKEGVCHEHSWHTITDKGQHTCLCGTVMAAPAKRCLCLHCTAERILEEEITSEV